MTLPELDKWIVSMGGVRIKISTKGEIWRVTIGRKAAKTVQEGAVLNSTVLSCIDAYERDRERLPF
jgi:hypothetical protein